MGRVLAAVACVVACRFAPSGRAPPAADAPVDVAPDGPPDAPPSPDAGMLRMNGSACGGAVWHADFSVDPTTIDLNGDGIDDFAVRGGGPLPGTLGSGMWMVPAASLPLDTQPKQPFTTRVVIDVTMQNISPASGSDSLSTLVWINTAYSATMFAPLYVDLRRDSSSASSQTVTVYGKTGSADVQTKLDGISFGDDNLHHFHLDIDPTALTYHLVIDGSADRGTLSYPAIPLAGNTDQWATVDASGGDSVFDDFQVEVCP